MSTKENSSEYRWKDWQELKKKKIGIRKNASWSDRKPKNKILGKDKKLTKLPQNQIMRNAADLIAEGEE